MQRLFDILFSFIALLVLSPLLIVVCIVLKLTGEGEIFFLQERIGINGSRFNLYKFATMLKNSPYIGSGTVTMKDDPRVLPLGKFLRKTKINELPQLINIFIGNMSVIGPRPLTPQNFGFYDPNIQKIITLVRPGLSGIGSIIFRGEEDIMHGEHASINFYNDFIAPYKGQLEEWYVDNKSFYLYFLLIFLTLWMVLFPKSDIIWKSLKKLPKPPYALQSSLNYKS